MKKLAFVLILMLMMSAVLSACTAEKDITDTSVTTADSETEVLTDSIDSESGISKDMAYEGVYNYCRSTYDWSIAEENPDIMYVKNGEETENEYQVIFRSYTGAFVYFYVDKSSGNTRIVEYVPALDIEEEAGAINLYDYLESEK